jgi:hypothetical protein
MKMDFFEPLKKEITFQNMVLSIKEICIFILLAIFLLGQWGCATQPPGLPAELRAQLGTIGVVSAQYTPAFEFEMPAKGWLGGAGRGAVGGTKAFIVLVPSGAVLAGASAVVAFAGGVPGVLGAVMSVGLVLKGAGYLIIGPFYGAAAAEAPATVEEAEAQLKAALASMRIQETMRDHVVQAAHPYQPNVDLTVVDGQGPKNASDLLTYFPLQNTNIDSVLELRVTRLWLSSNESFFQPLRQTFSKKDESPIDLYRELEINPSLSLGMEVRGRLIRTADKVVLYDNTWKYEGGARLFTEWAAHAAQPFAEEFVKAYGELANQVVATIFKSPTTKR